MIEAEKHNVKLLRSQMSGWEHCMNQTGTDLQLGSDSIKKAHPSQGLQEMTNDQKCWKPLPSDDFVQISNVNKSHSG